jgi:dipeptidyl aminopeptidase/acylaminoacyl peptidase
LGIKHKRVEMKFLSHGTECSAWLYVPEGSEKPPVIVMAHGIACEKTFRLPAFAEFFAERGLAVFVFDYRCIGGSDGGPRNLVYSWRQVQDWEAAIAYVRTLPQLDTNRIGLWGSSFSGGHVIVAASRDAEIVAVSAHVPFSNGMALVKSMGFLHVFQTFGAGVKDLFRIISLSKPYKIPVVADPGTLACMNSPGAKTGYLAMVPGNSRWENRCPARSCVMIPFYRPIRQASRVRCPVLIIMGDKDQIISPRSVVKLSRRLKKCKLVRLPMGHFDSYLGEMFDQVVELQADFFIRHLTSK